jgi:hypothetical protein
MGLMAQIGRGADVSVQVSSHRTVFARMENSASVRVTIQNNSGKSLRNAVVKIALSGKNSKEYPLDELKNSQSREIDYPIDTRLRAADYTLEAAISSGGKPLAEMTGAITLVNRRPPRMPVLLRGTAHGPEEQRLAEQIGFTGSDQILVKPPMNPLEAGNDLSAAPAKRYADVLNDAMKKGWAIQASFTGAPWPQAFKALHKVARDGKPLTRSNIDGLYAQVQKLCHDMGRLFATRYAGFPALRWVLIHSESRVASDP